MKVRIKYAKTGSLKFIGHLDVMRFFQKAIRRAGIDVAYSKGFSPHQLITFAAPLGLGITSEGEYFDAELNSLMPTKEMVERFNQVMVDGMKVLDVVLLPEEAKTAMAVVAASDYYVTIRPDYYENVDFLRHVDAFYQSEEINILKKTKKNERVENIKPFIFEMKPKDEGIYMFLSTGSTDNLKPELVMEAFCSFLHVPFEKFGFMVHRIETYMEDSENQYVSLSKAGEVIQ